MKKYLTFWKETPLEVKIKGWFYFLSGIFLLALLIVNFPWFLEQIMQGTLYDSIMH